MPQWLDRCRVDDERRRPVIYFLIKLAAASGQFPSALFITGVKRSQEEQVLGGYADVYQAVYQNRLHAAKCLRMYNPERADFNRVRRTSLSARTFPTDISDSYCQMKHSYGVSSITRTYYRLLGLIATLL